jgi:hypothetical protein
MEGHSNALQKAPCLSPVLCAIKSLVNTFKRLIIATQLLLIFPAGLFMAALVLRTLQSQQGEPAHTAQWIVMWYAGRQWTLWVLLIALPLAVLVIGCAGLLRVWNDDAGLRQVARHPRMAIHTRILTLLIAATTLIAGLVLVVVGLHMLMN